MIKLLNGMVDVGEEGDISWFEPRQEKLRELIGELSPANLIEIGFNLGHSCKLICDVIVGLKLAQESYFRERVNFYIFDIGYYNCVEPNFKILQEYYKLYNIELKLIIGSSLDTLNPFIRDCNTIFDFVEVDGAHTSEAVYSDVINVYDKIRSGGVIYIDDYQSHEVPCPLVDAGVDLIDWNGYSTSTGDGLFIAIKD